MFCRWKVGVSTNKLLCCGLYFNTCIYTYLNGRLMLFSCCVSTTQTLNTLNNVLTLHIWNVCHTIQYIHSAVSCTVSLCVIWGEGGKTFILKTWTGIYVDRHPAISCVTCWFFLLNLCAITLENSSVLPLRRRRRSSCTNTYLCDELYKVLITVIIIILTLNCELVKHLSLKNAL